MRKRYSVAGIREIVQNREILNAPEESPYGKYFLRKISIYFTYFSNDGMRAHDEPR